MSEFRTVISLLPAPVKIGLNDRILTFGSCFSDAIGTRLRANKFPVLINPFGTIYNPGALHRLIIAGADNSIADPFSNVKSHDIYFNYDFHSSFSAMDEEDLNRRIRDSISLTHSWLKDASCIILTYGTAWAYRHKESGKVVSNCHKMPATIFEKHLQTPEEIIASFDLMYHRLKSERPDIKIILTVSPVRHTKDTLPLSAASKATLRLVCHQLSTCYPDVEYFPAFEIMTDDLRDYRFYKKDMIHPTEQAEDYIWDAFTNCYCSEETLEFIRKWTEIRRALEHRPFQPHSSGHRNFLSRLLMKVEALRMIAPVEEEVKQIKRNLEQLN